jgi:hypothetical protein
MKIISLKYMTAIVLFALTIQLVLYTLTFAAAWYVRPGITTYGNGSGSSYENAWSGFSNIQWGTQGIQAGDTLFICGTHGSTLNIGTNGTTGAPVSVSGSCGSDEGKIDGAKSINYGINTNGRSFIKIINMIIMRTLQDGIYASNSSTIEVGNSKFYEIGSNVNYSGIKANYGSGYYFYNNIFDNSLGTYSGVGITVGLGSSPNGQQNIVENNHISGLQGDGIVVGDNTIVDGNTVSNLMNVVTHSDGIVIQGSNVIVKRNSVFDCTQNIYVNSFDYGSGSRSITNNVAIFSNLIHRISSLSNVNGLIVDCEGGQNGTRGMSSITGLKIYNNTIADCNYGGMVVNDRTNEGGCISNLDIRNNLVVNSGGYRRLITFGGKQVSNLILNYNMTYNNVYESSTDVAYLWYGNHLAISGMRGLGYQANGLSQKDPHFVQYSYTSVSNNYHLLANSPARNAGVNLGSDYNTDKSQNTHPSGAWSIGCYEYSTVILSAPMNLRVIE